MFYHNLTISNDGLYLTTKLNRVDMELDKDTLSELRGPTTVGIKFVRLGEGGLHNFWEFVVNMVT